MLPTQSDVTEPIAGHITKGGLVFHSLLNVELVGQDI